MRITGHPDSCGCTTCAEAESGAAIPRVIGYSEQWRLCDHVLRVPASFTVSPEEMR